MADQHEGNMERLERAVRELSEHFDCVQIFTQKHEPIEMDGTSAYTCGSGNFYARQAQVREWVIQQDERAMVKVRNDSISEHQDDDEDEDDE